MDVTSALYGTLPNAPRRLPPNSPENEILPSHPDDPLSSLGRARTTVTAMLFELRQQEYLRPINTVMIGEMQAVLHDLESPASLWRAESRLNWLVGVADDEVQDEVNLADEVVSALVEDQWRKDTGNEALQAARLAQLRNYLARGDYFSALGTFWRVRDAHTAADRRALLALALDHGDYDTACDIYKELQEPVPPTLRCECANMVWRQFRDALNAGGKASGRTVFIMIDDYLEAGASDLARQRAYEYFDLLRRHRSFELWDEHAFWLFEILSHVGVVIAEEDARDILEWAVDGLRATDPGAGSERERRDILDLIRDLTRHRIMATARHTEGLP